VKTKLSPKELVFCKMLAKGSSGVDAYLATHENASDDRSLVAVKAYHYKQGIIEKIGYNGFLDLLGVSDEAISKAHEASLKSSDERVKLSAVKLGYQVRGRMIERQSTDMNLTGVPTTFTAWLRHDTESKDQDPETPDDAGNDSPD
jgi:type II secretory pathway component PulJ